jgi:hypothetical protein
LPNLNTPKLIWTILTWPILDKLAYIHM